MFKFDFNVEEDEGEISPNKIFKDSKTVENNTDSETHKKSVEEWYDSVEVKPNELLASSLDFCELNSIEIEVGSTTLRHIISGMLLEDIKANIDDSKDIRKSEENHTDLIPAIYEGGAKIWECTDDLLKFLATNYTKENWENKHILDLGCGAGLLGIYALKNGAITCFQDYNQDVLERITIPNVLLNVKPENGTESLEVLLKNTKFYAGDWASFALLTEHDEKFDVILTSETIYNPVNQQKLLDVFHKRLNRNGVVLVAAKTYYFGVGGGLRQFEKLITDDKRFKSKVLWLSTEGVNREIIELKFN